MQEMQEIWMWFLGWEDPLEEEIATHSSILAWNISWTEEPGELHGISKSWTWLSTRACMCTHTHIHTHTHTDVYILISRTLEYTIFLIKGMLQDLEKIILHCLVRTNAITKILKRERQEIRVWLHKNENRCQEKMTLKMKKGPWAKKYRKSLDSGKDKETLSLLEPVGKT